MREHAAIRLANLLTALEGLLHRAKIKQTIEAKTLIVLEDKINQIRFELMAKARDLRYAKRRRRKNSRQSVVRRKSHYL